MFIWRQGYRYSFRDCAEDAHLVTKLQMLIRRQRNSCKFGDSARDIHLKTILQIFIGVIMKYNRENDS